MNRVKAIISVIMILAIGIGIGVFSTYYMGMRRFQNAINNPEKLSQILVERMAKKIHMNNEQQIEFVKIARSARLKIKKIRIRVMPEIEEIFQETEMRVMDILTLDQKEAFNKIIKKRETLLNNLSKES